MILTPRLTSTRARKGQKIKKSLTRLSQTQEGLEKLYLQKEDQDQNFWIKCNICSALRMRVLENKQIQWKKNWYLHPKMLKNPEYLWLQHDFQWRSLQASKNTKSQWHYTIQKEKIYWPYPEKRSALLSPCCSKMAPRREEEFRASQGNMDETCWKRPQIPEDK